MKIVDPISATVDQLVHLQTNFMASIDLEKAYDPTYRAKCSNTYIYLSEDEAFFTSLVNALSNLLPNGLHVILETGPYGAGKSLLDIVRGDLFATPNNQVILDKLPKGFWKEQIEEITRDAGSLVIYIGGTHHLTQSNLDSALTDALEKALPPGIQVNSQFDRASAWIASTYPGGENEFLRLRFEQCLGTLNSNSRLWTIGELEEGLRLRISNALDVFRKTLDDTMSWPGATFGAATAAEIYEEIRTAHVGNQRQFSSIIIFFDEFSQWANSASAKDISTLQSFVEWVNRSKRVAMVMSSQIRPQRQGDGHNELETLISRTYPVEFNRTSYAGLLAGAIERLILPFPPVDSRSDWSRLADLHQELFPHDKEPEKIVRRYYPFHPVTVKALPALADQLGYRERSIALYLSMGKDTPGFGKFLQGPLFEDDRGDLRLITLDRLFPYFEARLRDDNPPIYARYEQAISAASDELSRRLVMALALCDVLEARSPLASTPKNLVRILNLSPEDPDSSSNVQQQLQNLEDVGLIFNDGQDHYKLSAAGGLTLTRVNRAINQRKQAMINAGVPISARDAIAFIEEALFRARDLSHAGYPAPQEKDLPFSKSSYTEPCEVKSEAYRAHFKINRMFRIQLVSRQQLSDWRNKVAMDPKNVRYDTILVVIATDTDSQQVDLAKLPQAAYTLAQAGMTVGIPKAPFTLSDTIRETLAAQQIGQDELYRNAPVMERALKHRLSQLLSQIVKEVRVDAFDWYLPDLTSSDQPISLDSLEKLADRAAMYLGKSFPFGITTENLIISRLNKEVVTSLLQSSGIQLTRNNQKSQKERIIHDALTPIGLIKETRGGIAAPVDSAEVIEPDPIAHADTRAIWDIVDAALGKGGNGAAIAQVVQTLSQKPYWLLDDLGIYILSAFIGFRGLHILKSGQAESHSKDTMKKLWDNPADYVLKLPPRTTLSPDARLLLDDLQITIKGVLPQSRLSLIEIKQATFLSEDQVNTLNTMIRLWDTKVGKNARDTSIRLKLSFPSPLKEWLAFLKDLEEGTLDRTLGETYTTNLILQIRSGSGLTIQNISGMLDHQFRQLHQLVEETDMLNRAFATQQKQNAPEKLSSAWASFCTNPLDETLRRKLQAELTAATIETKFASPTEEPDKKAYNGAAIDTQRADRFDEQNKHISSGKVKETENQQEGDWQSQLDAIAAETITAGALQHCIDMIQRLLVQIEEQATMPSGKFVLSQIISALKPLED